LGNPDGNISIYVDNIINRTEIASAGHKSLFNSTENIIIGNYFDLSRDLNGSLEDIRIYNYTLMPEEIAYIYAEGRQ